MSAWLRKEDAVKNNACPSWLTLATALEKLDNPSASALPHEVQVDKLTKIKMKQTRLIVK